MGDLEGSMCVEANNQSLKETSQTKGQKKVWPVLSSLRQKVEESDSGIEMLTYTHHLALLPKYIGNINNGVKAYLNAELHSYSTVLEGVPLAYSRIQSLQSNALIVGDDPHLHLSVEVDIYVFRPQAGEQLRATVNKVGASHIGCLVHDCFNVSIAKPKKIDDASWKGAKLKLGDDIIVIVKEVFTHNRELSIRARLPKD